MKKTNLLFFTALVFLSVFLFSSCDILGSSSSSSTKADPQIRIYVSDGLYYCYFNIATYDSSSELYYYQSSWQYSSYGSYSNYVSVDSGSYYLIFDGDTDHSYFDARSTYLESLESDKKYTCFVSHNGSYYIYSLVED